MNAYLVSDLHLESSRQPRALCFLAWLQSLVFEAKKGELATLVLLGDIFDFWIGAHEHFLDEYRDIVLAIRELQKNGVEVHYFEGNHDLHLKDFWQDRIGVQVHTSGELLELAGWRVWCEHGDLINPNDKGYLFLRSVLRSTLFDAFQAALPSRAVQWLGERASRLSRNHTNEKRERSIPEELVREMIRTFAEKKSEKVFFDYIITGHVHVNDEFKKDLGKRSFVSINLGSWFEFPTALKMTKTGHQIADLSQFIPN
jgi:UDP-2,3-diacylglucosamine hydrolase